MNNPDVMMEVQTEEYGYRKWEREQKNRILAMHNVEKKREAWSKLFPTMVLDDAWLNDADVF